MSEARSVTTRIRMPVEFLAVVDEYAAAHGLARSWPPLTATPLAAIPAALAEAGAPSVAALLDWRSPVRAPGSPTPACAATLGSATR
jgi:hypothetical protein